jgi:type II secretory pathway pseudopilin PulG
MTLVECLVSMTLLGFAILMSSLLLGTGPRAARRLEAKREALGALENALEGVRAGAIPLEGGKISVPLGPRPLCAGDLQVALDVRPTETAGLYEVVADARYVVLRKSEHRGLTTMVWAP